MARWLNILAIALMISAGAYRYFVTLPSSTEARRRQTLTVATLVLLAFASGIAGYLLRVVD